MPRRKSDISEEWETKMEEIQNKFKKQLKIIEEQNKKNIEEIRKLKEREEKHQEEIRKLENKWEEKYSTKIEEMESRYINTFRNLEDNWQQQNVNQKEEIYRGSTVDIAKPLFYGNRKDTHPIDFLCRLDEYFAVKQIKHTDEKIIIAGDCLKATASNWLATIRFQINSYEDFKYLFKDEYWSRDIQMQVWSQCLNTKQVQQETSYREHFSFWANKLRHLEVPKLAENEIVKNIAGHYPGYLRAILISLPECTILKAMKILGAEEHRRPMQKESNQYENRPQQNRENNNHFRPQREEPLRREGNWNRSTPRNNDSRDNNNQERNRDQGQNNNQQGRDSRRINQINIEEISNDEVDNESHTINSVNTGNAFENPYLKCTIEDELIQALVDTGAAISVINKELADKLLKKNQEIPVLPMNNVQINNIVGRKICKVPKQLVCSCQIGDKQLFINFKQVENLNEQAIIGTDVLRQYNAHINFKDKTIHWSIQGDQRTTPFSENIGGTSTKENQITQYSDISYQKINRYNQRARGLSLSKIPIGQIHQITTVATASEIPGNHTTNMSRQERRWKWYQKKK